MILSLLSNFVNVCNSNDQFSFHERDPSNWILLLFRQSFHLRCPTFHPEASTEAFGCSEAAVGSVTEEGKGSNVARPRKASCRILKTKVFDSLFDSKFWLFKSTKQCFAQM